MAPMPSRNISWHRTIPITSRSARCDVLGCRKHSIAVHTSSSKEYRPFIPTQSPTSPHSPYHTFQPHPHASSSTLSPLSPPFAPLAPFPVTYSPVPPAHLRSLDPKARNLRQIRRRRQLEYMHVVIHIMSIEPSKDEDATVGEERDVVSAWRGRTAEGSAGFELEGDCWFFEWWWRCKWRGVMWCVGSDAIE